MFTNFASVEKMIAYPKMRYFARMFFLAMVIALVMIMTTGFVRIQTDQVIAPPGLRLMDLLWRMFIVRY